MLSTTASLLPASLSLVLGLIKAATVLKSSLPWVRLPSFQLVLIVALVVPLVVAIMAGLFQLAADWYERIAQPPTTTDVALC